jgi:hypothetical protein
MEPRGDLITSENVSYCLAKENEIYAIYVEANAHKIKLNLGNIHKIYSVQWFDPRNGGKLQNGSITTITADGLKSLGFPPSKNKKDWLLLIRSKS